MNGDHVKSPAAQITLRGASGGHVAVVGMGGPGRGVRRRAGLARTAELPATWIACETQSRLDSRTSVSNWLRRHGLDSEVDSFGRNAPFPCAIGIEHEPPVPVALGEAHERIYPIEVDEAPASQIENVLAITDDRAVELPFPDRFRSRVEQGPEGTRRDPIPLSQDHHHRAVVGTGSAGP